MLSEIALPILLSPVGVMLAGAAISGALAILAWRSVSKANQPDTLTGLFERGALKGQLSDPRLRDIRARGQRRTVRGHNSLNPLQREAMLHHAAAVMRGSERDPGIEREVTRYLAGEGFIILSHTAEPEPTDSAGERIAFGEFEEVEDLKLLPPPSPAAKAA